MIIENVYALSNETYFAKLSVKDAFSLLDIEMNFNEHVMKKHFNFILAVNIHKETGGEIIYSEETRNLFIIKEKASLIEILLTEELKEINPFSTIGLKITHYSTAQLLKRFGKVDKIDILKKFLENR
ncbi:hypothetical protein [Bacillus taeanensis]|uniref:Uncharacterized protein n=1 Tax=Bacillus taeanensis TaxID=273032 RepID=A0A366XY81_9BACI|nr:hypothetical protein [Bacillus taeanensis]RBW71102.1 hypothetical protein DS031_03665 [Bacillus taeanensis]